MPEAKNVTNSKSTKQRFFRDRRRKAGVVVLLMALVVWSCWLRSLLFSDYLMINSGTVIASSTPNDLALLVGPAALAQPWKFPTWLSVANGPPGPPRTDWTWQFCGFRYGHQMKGKAKSTTEHPDGRVTTTEVDYIAYDHVWVIPYWSITLPLTVVATYLLVIPSRKRTFN